MVGFKKEVKSSREGRATILEIAGDLDQLPGPGTHCSSHTEGELRRKEYKGHPVEVFSWIQHLITTSPPIQQTKHQDVPHLQHPDPGPRNLRVLLSSTTANPQKIVIKVLCGAMLNLAPPARIWSHLQDSTGSSHMKLVPPLPCPFPTPEELERIKKEEISIIYSCKSFCKKPVTVWILFIDKLLVLKCFIFSWSNLI